MRAITIEVPSGVQYRSTVHHFLNGYRARAAGWLPVEGADLNSTRITLTAPEAEIAPGHILVGVYDSTDGVQALAGVTEPIEGNFATCAHCGTRRAKQHLILRDVQTGNLYPIGKTCAEKQLSIDGDSLPALLEDPQTVINNRASFIDASPHYPTSDVIAAALVAVQEYGYISTAQALANNRMSTARTMEQILRDQSTAITGQLLYAEMLALWLNDDCDTDSDFFTTARDAVNLDAIPTTLFGVIAALPTAQTRLISQSAAREAGFDSTAPYVNEFYGQVGERVTVDEVLIVRTRDLDTGSTLVEMRTEDGRKLTWFATNPAGVPDAGSIVRLVGTVKKHDIYRDQYATIVNRCVLTVV